MTVGMRSLQLGGVSALALASAILAGTSPAAAVCTAASIAGPAVSVTCSAGGPATGSFQTSYGDGFYDGNGPDVFTMTGGQIVETGAPTPIVDGDPLLPLDPSTGVIDLLGGNNVVNISGGTIGTAAAPLGIVMAALDPDSFTMSGGTITGGVFGLGGGNTYTVSGGTIAGGLFAGSQNDNVTVSGTALIQANPAIGTDAIGLEDGDDVFLMTGGTLQGSLSGGAGNDQITVNGGNITQFLGGNAGSDTIVIGGGTIGGNVDGGDDDDVMRMTGGSVAGNFTGGQGADNIQISGGTVAGTVFGGTENDVITLSGGTVAGDISGDAGDDTINVTGGTLTGSVLGGTGTDTVNVSAGTINGGITAETVNLSGGTIGGDISGLSANTLNIDDSLSAAALSLRNGVVFTGAAGDAVADIANTDLAAGGTQNFAGFANVTLDAATLSFGGGTQGISTLLALGNGSTLFVNGAVNIAGTLSATNSTISMADGVADDVLTLGGIVLNSSRITVDVDQRTAASDQINAATFVSTGTNVIAVSLLGAPAFAGVTDIPIINGPVTGTFAATGITGTPSSLFNFEILQGPEGLFLRATPNNVGLAAAAQNAADVSALENALRTADGVHKDALDFDLGLANRLDQKVMLTPVFGVFASGQFAHTNHDGFDISSNGVSGVGPGFDANDFSAALSFDLNLSKTLDLDPQYGLNLGVYGGYASTDVDIDGFNGFGSSDASNKAGMVGVYGLFRKEYNYALVAATGFFGDTDINNAVLASTGSYGTQGYTVTGSFGHIFVIGERTRFDLRGGVLGAFFNGDDYTDSAGNRMGGSSINFGAVKLEPGVYADYKLENGMILSPYARAELQQRFAYENDASVDDVDIDFDDADFSAALSTGFNMKVSDRATVSGEVRGKASSDSQTIGGKIGLKVAF